MLENETRECISLITAAKTAEYPRGDARNAFLAIDNTFKPKDKHTKLELKRLFQNEKLEDAEDDPETWITELTNLPLRLEEVQVKMSDEDFWLHVLRNLPEVYKTMVELLMRDLEEDNLKSDDAMSILRATFKRVSKGSDTSDRLLMSWESKLECRHCGKSGHRAENCWIKPENCSKMEEWKNKNNDGGSSGYKPKCHICGETGHRQYQCSKVKRYKCNKLGHMKSDCP